MAECCQVYSELHDELYALDLLTQRWRPLVLRAPKSGPKVPSFLWHASRTFQGLDGPTQGARPHTFLPPQRHAGCLCASQYMLRHLQGQILGFTAPHIHCVPDVSRHFAVQ